MPSLPAIEAVERESGLPVLSAATSTAYAILRELGLTPSIPGAGSLLSR
jgi:maleate isomerase